MVRPPIRDTRQARIAQSMLRTMGGWRYVGDLPEPRRAVALAVPHTSNLDGLLLVLLARSVGMSITWMIKDTWTRPPLGLLVRAVGGVGIDRSRPRGMVGQMIDEFARRDELLLVIPPEGTRGRVEHWKSGFYRIALGAKVPVVPGFLDYGNKVGGFGKPIDLTGDPKADMDTLRAFYKDAPQMARYPKNFGPVRLRDEEQTKA